MFSGNIWLLFKMRISPVDRSSGHKVHLGLFFFKDGIGFFTQLDQSVQIKHRQGAFMYAKDFFKGEKENEDSERIAHYLRSLGGF